MWVCVRGVRLHPVLVQKGSRRNLGGPSLLGTHVLHHVSSESGDLLDERVSFFPSRPTHPWGFIASSPWRRLPKVDER
jgi:hypothetical protein